VAVAAVPVVDAVWLAVELLVKAAALLGAGGSMTDDKGLRLHDPIVNRVLYAIQVLLLL
jgi:hypothetical protein